VDTTIPEKLKKRDMPLLPGSALNFNPFILKSKLESYDKQRISNLKKFKLNHTGSNNCKPRINFLTE
jgi:hypothetical protein